MKPQMAEGKNRTPEAATAMMSADEFARWHVEDILFVRRVVDGFAVFGADGTFLDVVGSMGEVVIAARDHDMQVLSVH